MKRLCKDVNIMDRAFIRRSILGCLSKRKKRLRFDTVRLFARLGKISEEEARLSLKAKDEQYLSCVDALAEEMQRQIQEGNLHLPTAHHKRGVVDPSSGKARDIAVLSIRQLIFDHIAVDGMAQLFRRVGNWQCASIAGRGQTYGIRAVKRWLKDTHVKYAAKLDISKCYDSMKRERVMDFLRRRIKNPALLWLVEALLITSPRGFLIGSYLSQTLCNLYLSELYHEVSERMWHERRTRRAGTRRVNLVRHILLYMDDVLLLGRNAKHLHEAVRRIVAYCRDTLCLNIKPSRTVFKLDDKHGVDMMGYKLFKGFSTIRRRVFKRLRRCTLRMLRRARVGAHIPVSMARRFISLSGYLTHTDSWRFCHRYHVAALKKIAGLIVSHHDHNKTLITA